MGRSHPEPENLRWIMWRRKVHFEKKSNYSTWVSLIPGCFYVKIYVSRKTWFLSKWCSTGYYWMNGTLYAQKTGEEYLYFLYDESGMAYGFVVKNNTENAYYYYEFNLQGDIIGIVNSAGTKVVEYTYGAWGDILTITGSMATTIGQKNPLRYRGYYYDGETGFYYVTSRYYDPEVGRWLSPEPNVDYGEFQNLLWPKKLLEDLEKALRGK